MNAENQIQYILLGAVLTFHEHADVLQDLEIEDFCPELQRTFADISGFWQCRDKWDALSVMEFYPDDKVTMLQCTEEQRRFTMVMNYNQQSEDFNTLDRPIASEDNTVRFEDGSTMDIHEDSSLMESEIYTHVSHAMDDKVIARIYDFVTEIAPLPSTLNDEDAKVVHECIGRQCDFFNNSTSQQERALFDALHLDERDAIRCFLHTYFSDLNDDAQYSFFDENPNALDELHRATNAMELVRKAYPDIIRQTGSI